MTDMNVLAKPAATSWGAVLGGWVATIGASVIFAPLVAGLVAIGGEPQSPNDVALAVPVVLGILLSYVAGGYVAGRMAGYRTSWHGMMTAFLTLFVLLAILIGGVLVDTGILAGSGIRSMTDVLPGLRDLNVDSFSTALSFGAILGFLAAIFGGWLGGLLAPDHMTAAVVPQRPAPAVRETRSLEAKPRRSLLPAFGRKGGQRAEDKSG